MAEIVWSDKAVTDLELINSYVAADSPFYARVQIERIFKSVNRLSSFPESGRKLPEFPALRNREIIVGAYRCIYRFEKTTDRVFMVTVVHGRRMLIEDMLQENRDTPLFSRK
jgi:plasmid stabilization system protein ParE